MAAELHHLEIVVLQDVLDLVGVLVVNLRRHMQLDAVHVLCLTDRLDSVYDRHLFAESVDVEPVAQVRHPPDAHTNLVLHGSPSDIPFLICCFLSVH